MFRSIRRQGVFPVSSASYRPAIGMIESARYARFTTKAYPSDHGVPITR